MSGQHNISAKPRRRWFRFGLRTMFVVLTVFLVWLGWQAKIVRERREAMAAVRDSGGYVSTDRADGPAGLVLLYPFVPIWRQWLGDERVYLIHVSNDGPSYQRLGDLFPEANITDGAEWTIASPHAGQPEQVGRGRGWAACCVPRMLNRVRSGRN